MDHPNNDYNPIGEHQKQQQQQQQQQQYSSEESENDDEILENEYPTNKYFNQQQQQHDYSHHHHNEQHNQNQDELNRISIDENSDVPLQNENNRNSSWIDKTHEFEAEYVSHTHPRFFFLITATCIGFALLFTWCWITFTPYTFPWFIYPVAVSLTLAFAITILGARRIQRKLFSFHMWMFIIWNIVLVITNDKTTSFPWSVIPLLIWSSGFIIHGIWEYYRSVFSFLTCHTVVYITFCFLIYIIWCYATPRGFPWFVFPIALWGFILIGHASFNIYRKNKNNNNSHDSHNITSVDDTHNQNMENVETDHHEQTV